ncbi:MAG: family 43 glycosylhydrolase [Chitinispirillaceae bacterium]
MNKTLFPCLYLAVLFSIQLAFADNPIITQTYTADPNAMVWNGRVYVYCSRDDNNDDGYDIVDYTLVSSDDMVNWTDHGEVFHAGENTDWAGLAYAPAAIARNGKVYLYFPNGASNIGVAVADRPEGPFTDPLGGPLVDRSTPGVTDEVAWVFDPGVFIDDDGQAYLYFGGGGDNHNENLQGIKLNDDMISVSGSAVTIGAPNAFEAAYVHKYDGTYYFTYSSDFSEGSARIDYMMSDDPLTGYEYVGTVLDNPTLDGQNINTYNNNHASIIEFQENWYIFYHDRRLSNETYFRNVSVDLVTYNTDGTMNETAVTAEGPSQIKYLNPFDTVQAETINLQSGIETAGCSEGGIMVTSISDGDYIRVKGVDFGAGASNFNVRAASGSSGGSIELRLGSPEGTLVGTCDITGTGGWNTWETFQCEVTNCSGVEDLYLVFKGTDEPFRLNWYRFSGPSGYLLSVDTTGEGSVDRSPSSSGYEEGTSVTLTAQPQAGWEFHSWSGEGVNSSDNPLAITMDSDKTVTALFSRSAVDGNLVLNGDFSSDDSEWTLNVWEGRAAGSVVNGEYHMDLDSIGAENHHIQLVQPGLFLQNGETYEVTFDAYAASDRSLEVNVEMADDPWTSYLTETRQFDLTDAKQTFSFRFTMEHPTDVNGRLGFNMGASTEAVTIDNVSVKIAESTSALPTNMSVPLSSVRVNADNSVIKVQFRAHGSETVSLNIYDLKGNVIRSRSLRTSPGQICNRSFDLAGISNGYYMVKLGSENGFSRVSRFLLTK